MWVITGDIANLIIIIIGSGLLYFFLIYGVDFYRFIGMDIPGLILSLMFVLFCKNLLSFLFFILLNDLLVNLWGELYYIIYIS